MNRMLIVEVYAYDTSRNYRRALTVELSESSRAVTMVDGLPHAASISGSMNSFCLVAIYTTLDISRIGLVQARASGYSLVQSLGCTKILEKVEKFEKCEKN